MATPAKSPFAAMVGAKRRRMKSGGNASTIASNTKKEEPDLSDIDDDDEMNTQTSKCKGATTIPIFLKSKSSVKNKYSCIIATYALAGICQTVNIDLLRKLLTAVTTVALILLQRPIR